MDIQRQPNDAGIRVCLPDGSYGAPGAHFHQLGLAEPEKYDGLLRVGDAERFVVLIQDQNLTAQRTAASPGWAIVG